MKSTRAMYYERIKNDRKLYESNQVNRVLYLIIFKEKNLDKDSWVETESSISSFERLKNHRNFFGAIIYYKKDNLKAFKRAEEILRDGNKGLIVDMREEG